MFTFFSLAGLIVIKYFVLSLVLYTCLLGGESFVIAGTLVSLTFKLRTYFSQPVVNNSRW